MKKGQMAEGVVEKVNFPNKGIVRMEDGSTVTVKNVIPGQRVSFRITKVRKGKAEGQLKEIFEPAAIEQESSCPHFGFCGGCSYQTLSYEQQLKLKEEQVKELLSPIIGDRWEQVYEGINPSPRQFGYRNKMEFSFGDEYKDGPLALGMHRRGSFYDLVTVKHCQIVDEDFRQILSATLDFFQGKNIPYFHRMSHVGYLRHLLVRKAAKTEEILVDLVTTGQIFSAPGEKAEGFLSATPGEGEKGKGSAFGEAELLEEWKQTLLDLEAQRKLSGKIVGILHTRNDSVADVIRDEGTVCLYGKDYFREELLGLQFRITPFSFFQTNSLGAEVLYQTARSFIMDEGENALDGKLVYDLYSGTGTIAQMLASVCKKVVGVEIVEEAVEAAKENARENGLQNCEFLAGDVLKVLDTIEERPDFIVLDPPRDGIHPKALEKIIHYGVDRLIYISCKPTSLARDLEVLTARGYQVERVKLTDMFPATVHIECVTMLQRR